MWNGIDFSQFGAFTVVFILMGTALVIMYRQWSAERKRGDDIQNQFLEYVKETRDSVIEPLNEQITLSRQIYDFLVRNTNNRGS